MFNPSLPYGTPSPPPGGVADVARWDEYIKTIQEAMTASSGFERIKLAEQYKDAAAGRANAMRIAQLQEQGRRYGVDVGARTEMARLQENARQFDASHGLEMAKVATDYLSTPDRYFQAGDFLSMAGQLGRGGGVQPYGAQGRPQAKRWEDFAALAGFGNVPAVKAGGGGGMATYADYGGGGGGGGVDPRVKAARGVIDAIPPSEGSGMNADDWAALGAVEQIFRASKPGSYEKMRPGQQAMFRSGLGRLGYVPDDAIEDMRRSGIGQGRASHY